ncbi:MAG TPA: DivIVA domain-containing protein [Lactobacillaceae bacterium]|jgi:cell division initiation protein
MTLTPEEILNHEFTKKGSKAYLAADVDTFLDQVNNDYQAILQENNQLKAKVAELDTKVSELEAKRDQVNASILIAQEAADRLKNDTDVEAKKQLKQAQETATKIVNDAKQKAQVEAQRLADDNKTLVEEQNALREDVNNFKSAFAALLEKQKALLADGDLAGAVHALPLGQKTAEWTGNDAPEPVTPSPAEEETLETVEAPVEQEAETVVVFPEEK